METNRIWTNRKNRGGQAPGLPLWSSLTGLADLPDNYKTVTYKKLEVKNK
jgi:hypothetical protein